MSRTSYRHTDPANDRGAVAGEYSVILAVITVVLVAAVGALSLAITGNFQAVANLLP